MENNWIERISRQCQVKAHQVRNTLQLLDEGATIPFIARYRKERTGSLDETVIETIQQEFQKLRELEQRKETILAAISEQGKLNPELERSIRDCFDGTLLEDLYLPYKKRRETKADKARNWGLEPLAELIRGQKESDIRQRARAYTSTEAPTVDAAIEGALWIIAEQYNEDQAIRETLRNIFRQHARVESKASRGDKADRSKYEDYLSFSEKAESIPSHRLLAILRGEKEGALSVRITPDEELTVAAIRRKAFNPYGKSADLLQIALEDAYKRLLQPGIETQIRSELKEKADAEAIAVFARNMKQLLLAPPLGEKGILAIDPGFRTGCKVVCLSPQGMLLQHDTWYLHPPNARIADAEKSLGEWMERYSIEAVAVGDGTAGKETLDWISNILRGTGIEIYPVDESGASIYSASSTAREEFPDLDLTVRGSVSIGRRLADPMAELIKIDPKSIGVGQYQHDVDQKALKISLDQTLSHCVHQVGIRLNTASKYLLAHLSGIGPAVAQHIVDHRNSHGPFRSIRELLKVPKLGPKAFELAAGFLRIPDGDDPLDNTGVHPEAYPLARKMAKQTGLSLDDLIGNEAALQRIDLLSLVTPEFGLPTLQDMVRELAKPGLDPRGKAEQFSFDPRLRTLDDVQPGMIVNGIITNITKFGVFVDIGIKENGLIHVSQLSDQFVRDPAEVVHLRQQVTVRVTEVDHNRKRIGLSRKGIS